MRRVGLGLLIAVGALSGAPAGSALAASPSVEVMVVGKTRTLEAPVEVRVRARRTRVEGRRCAVGAATPLAALLALPAAVSLRDYGSCGRATRDAGGLFVRRIGPDANRGSDGWFYKVGRRSGTAGAGDRSGSFGDGRRLRDGQRVTWFYCDADADGDCQRTLEVAPAAGRVAAGGALEVTVRGFDNQGRGVAVAGAAVRLGDGATAITAADGTATVTVPAVAGTAELTAERDGMVPAFPREIEVR